MIDAAKGIAILAANGGHILEYEGIDRARRPLPPLIAAPTTAGSGSDVSQFCIVNDVDRMTKVTIIGRGLVPDVSVVDPRTLASLPADVAAVLADEHPPALLQVVDASAEQWRDSLPALGDE